VRAAAGVAAGEIVNAGGISARAMAMADEAMKGTLGARHRLVLLALVLGLAVGGAVLARSYDSEKEPPKDAAELRLTQAEKNAVGKQAALAADHYGDPLPRGAIGRLGTVRFNHGEMLHSLYFLPDGKTIASVG